MLKKYISEIIKAAVYCTITLVISTSVVSANIANKYDLNNDGVVNVIDLNNIKRQVLISSGSDYPDIEESRNIADAYLKENISETLYEGCSIETVVNTKNCTIVTVSCVYGNSSCQYNLGSGCYWTNGCLNHTMHKKISIFEGTSGTGVGKYSTFRLILISGNVKGFVVDTENYYKDTEIPVIPSEATGDWFYKNYISNLYFESSPALYVRNFNSIENAEVTYITSDDGQQIVEVAFYNSKCTHGSNELTNGYLMDKSSNVILTFKDKKLISRKFV